MSGAPTRVAVTGLGVACALGHQVDELWRRCLAGEQAVAPIPRHWHRHARYRSRLWSPLPQPVADWLGYGRVEAAQLDPVSLLALHGARQALAGAGFALEARDRRARTWRVPGLDASRAGVYMGSGVGGVSSLLQNHLFQLIDQPRERLLAALGAQGDDARSLALRAELEALALPPRFNPFVVSMLMPNAVSAVLGVKLGLEGPNSTVTLACASGTAAIGQALRALRAGEVEVALAGGAEYLGDAHGGIFRGFDVAGALVEDCADPARANRPFDAARSGFLYSEGGAAVLVLETLDGARARGAPVLAELAGYGESFDAHSLMAVAPEGRQVERMLRAALDDAALEPEGVTYVNAHGTGTVGNDAMECAVIERLFGRGAAVNATKSLLGHTLGASGALEAVVTVLSIVHRRLHPSLNIDTPIADLDFVTTARAAPIDAAISQSFAFGGHNAALVFRRVQT